MLMIVPLMIWSARTDDRQPGVQSDTRISPAQDREHERDDAAVGVAPKTGPGSLPRIGSRKTPADQPTNAADEHRALDADVDDARPLAHDAAQGGEGDRHRRPGR